MVLGCLQSKDPETVYLLRSLLKSTEVLVLSSSHFYASRLPVSPVFLPSALPSGR